MTENKTSGKTSGAKIPKSGPKGGRPRTKFATDAIKFDRQAPLKLDLKSRASLETFCNKHLEQIINSQAEDQRDSRVIMDAIRNQIERETAAGTVNLSLLRVFEQQQQKNRQFSNDMAKNLQTLMKQFQLFRSLNPDDENSHTPVSLVISTEPPEGTVRDNPFSLGDEDIDPDLKAG